MMGERRTPPGSGPSLQPGAPAQAFRRIPILLYHSVDVSPPAWIARFTVPPDVFDDQLDTIVSLGYQALTVSTLVDRLADGGPLPERVVVITLLAWTDAVEVGGLTRVLVLAPRPGF